MFGRIIPVLALALLLNWPVHAQPWTVRVDVRGRRIEGTPLSWSDDQVYLLGRDGRLWRFHPREVTSYGKIAPTFRSCSQADLRRQLLHEFGTRFDVSGTGQFLVVHPAGQRDRWAGRFEQLYRSFVHYWTARGLRPQLPQFPLVAIVFHRPADFWKYAASTGVQIGPGVLGYYSLTTNRVLLYDQSAGSSDPSGWQQNAATIFHEAAHQSAFNTGIHSRFAPPPQWVLEGLGTMFEARGVWDSRRYRRQSDRINRGRLKAFRRYAARRREHALAELVSSDRMFQSDPDGAYAESWALTFYLAETQPRKYFQYLAKTASRPPFTVYRPSERWNDFTSVFGEDLTMLDARLRRFLQSLK